MIICRKEWLLVRKWLYGTEADYMKKKDYIEKRMKRSGTEKDYVEQRMMDYIRGVVYL